MRAWVIEEHGGPEVFKEVELPTPEPGPGEVRIKVAATSVNPVDYKIRSGAAEALCPPKPAVLHGDVSGVVDKVGDRLGDYYKVGDPVYGCIGGYGQAQGALADYVITDSSIVHAPKSIPIHEAASLPLVSITTYEGLWKYSGSLKKKHVLVHAGTGGVGHIAIQMLKEKRARVATTVSSPQKAAIAAELGADDIIDYKKEGVESYVSRLTENKGFDVVFDTVGGSNIASSIEAVKPNGSVICIQGRTQIDGGMLHAKGVSLHLVFMLIPFLHDESSAIQHMAIRNTAELVDDGYLKPLIDAKRFTFDQIAEAHAYAESGSAIGKVLVVHPDHA